MSVGRCFRMVATRRVRRVGVGTDAPASATGSMLRITTPIGAT